MARLSARLLLFAASATTILVAIAQPPPASAAPTCEQVFKDIQVFKGVPASDLIPSMEFMAASLHYECSDCHDQKDYSADTRTKTTARHMILMQRDINTRNFNGRTEVTCMTCHGGKERPTPTPVPLGVALRHPRMENAPKPEDLFASHIAAVGKATGVLVRTGTLTQPDPATHKPVTKPVEFIQGEGGKFEIVTSEARIVSNGSQAYYGTVPVDGYHFDSLGRLWTGAEAFSGLEKPSVSGKENAAIFVRATRPDTMSTQELAFDEKTKLLDRVVNIRRSTLGNVVASVEYSRYKTVSGVRVPMRIVATYSGGEQYILDLKSAKFEPEAKPGTFEPKQP